MLINFNTLPLMPNLINVIIKGIQPFWKKKNLCLCFYWILLILETFLAN